MSSKAWIVVALAVPMFGCSKPTLLNVERLEVHLDGEFKGFEMDNSKPPYFDRIAISGEGVKRIEELDDGRLCD